VAGDVPGIWGRGARAALALEGLKARARQEVGIEMEELIKKVSPLIALAYDVEDAIKRGE
jgi:hypothetical protein